MSKINKIQHLVISHLQKHGQIELLLPDGVRVNIGILQENNKGRLVKSDNYCYVVASKGSKMALLDSYNLGLEYEDDPDTLVYQDKVLGNNGEHLCRLDIV